MSYSASPEGGGLRFSAAAASRAAASTSPHQRCLASMASWVMLLKRSPRHLAWNGFSKQVYEDQSLLKSPGERLRCLQRSQLALF